VKVHHIEKAKRLGGGVVLQGAPFTFPKLPSVGQSASLLA